MAVRAVSEPEKNPEGAVEKEALQAAAMLLRFLASLDRYEFTGGPQHTQSLTSASLADAKISGCYFPPELSAEEIRLSVTMGTRLRHSSNM